jgi:hypothetical protein
MPRQAVLSAAQQAALIALPTARAYPMAGKVKPSRLSRSYSRRLRALSNDAAKSQALAIVEIAPAEILQSCEVGSTYA